MNTKIINLLEIINKKLVLYQKHLDKITKECESKESFIKSINTKNFCDHWPLQYRYYEYDFLKGKKRIEKEKIILMYGLQRFIEFELCLEKQKYDKPYKLYLFFDGDEYFFKRGTLLWPYISFCNNKKYLYSYDTERNVFQKGKSVYAEHIRELLEELHLLELFNIFEYQSLKYNDEAVVVLDFKEQINKFKVNASFLLSD